MLRFVPSGYVKKNIPINVVCQDSQTVTRKRKTIGAACFPTLSDKFRLRLRQWSVIYFNFFRQSDCGFPQIVISPPLGFSQSPYLRYKNKQSTQFYFLSPFLEMSKYWKEDNWCWLRERRTTPITREIDTKEATGGDIVNCPCRTCDALWDVTDCLDAWMVFDDIWLHCGPSAVNWQHQLIWSSSPW